MTTTPDTTYVATIGEFPTAAGTDLDAVKAHALAEEARYLRPGREVQWQPHGHSGWRLMSRTGGKGRWAWTQRAIHTVPTVTTPADGGATR